MKKRSKTNRAKRGGRISIPSRIDPTKTSKLRRDLCNILKSKFNLIKKKIVDLIVLEDALGLKTYLVNANPEGCNQHTGPNCSGNTPDEKQSKGGNVRKFTLTKEQDTSETPTKLTKIVGKLKAAGAKAKHIEEAVAAYVKDKVATNIAKLPKPMQKVVNVGLIAGKVVTKTAFVTWISSQALAEQVSKEKGRTDEEAKKLRSTLEALDIAAYKPSQIIAMIGLGPAAAFTSMIPPATSIYLAYSTAKNPLATIRAAKTLVKNLISKLKRKPKDTNPPDTPTVNVNSVDVNLIDESLKSHNYDDWYYAILLEVMNEYPGEEIPTILETANQIYDENPEDLSFPREDDVDYFSQSPTNNRRWSLKRDPDKVKAFQQWIAQQIGLTLTSQNEEEIWRRFALEGMKKGAARSFDDVKKSAKKNKTYKDWRLQQEYYNGTKEQFLMSSFVQPVATEKLQLLAMRSFDDLWNITDDMSTRMSRTLLDGLSQGSSPREIARSLSKDVDLSKERALTVARTEIVRAHADGQLLALEGLGVEELGVAVEWLTTGDERVCKACQPLEGIVLKIEEAQNMLPRHPNCRCSWIPANVGEDDEDQIATRGEIKSALEESEEELSGGWKSPRISRDRPESIFNSLRMEYKFKNAPEVVKIEGS